MSLLEPNLRGTAAFFSPTTGIIDSYGLMRYFLGKARDKNAQIAYKAEVIDIGKVTDGYIVKVKSMSEDFSFMTRVLINCAGLHSDKVAKMAGIDIDKTK